MATRDEFAKAVVTSGLISAEDLQTFWKQLPADQRPKDGETFGTVLVQRSRLTEYQKNEILAGRGKALVLGNYTLLDQLGQGGMGMVLKAEHRRMERIVALKVLAPHAVKSPEALQRFLREVKAAAKLTHPNIVAAFDADEANGTHFFVMEYVEGSDLAARVKQTGPLPVAEAIRCVVQAAKGLEFAHQRGVVHRDIKPHNLLLDRDGTVKILDMGLARIESAGAEQAELTGTGQIMGTIDYMAPEQARNTKHADQRADVYSLGMTLWYLLTGQAAYAGETVIEKLMAHQTQPVPSLAAMRKDVAKSLDEVFQRMVAKRVEERFQSMSEVIAALERCKSDDGLAPTTTLAPSESAKLSQLLNATGSNALAPSIPQALAAVAVAPYVSQPSPTAASLEQTVALPQPVADTDPHTATSLPVGVVAESDAGRNMSAQFRQAGLAILARIRRNCAGLFRPTRRLAISAGIAGFLLVLLGVWVIVKNKRGEEAARIQVPDGGTVTVQSDSPESPPHATTSSNFEICFAHDDYVDIPSLKLDGKRPFTIEGLVTIEQHLPEEYVSFVRAEPAFRFGLSNRGHLSTSELKESTNFVASKNALPLTRRMHVAVAWDGQQAKLFVDGQEVAAKAFNKSFFAQPANSLQLGKPFIGLLDEIHVSDVARYSERFSPPNRFTSDEHTLGLYHCDEGDGETLTDSSPHEHHGRIVGAKWTRADGTPVGPRPAGDFALQCDGQGGALVPSLDLPRIGPMTIEAYLTVTKLPDGSKSPCVLGRAGQVRLFVENGKWGFIVHQVSKYTRIDKPLGLQSRVHIAGVRTRNEMRLFVDGKLLETQELKDAPANSGKGEFRIGEAPFVGLIDEIHVSNVARYDQDFAPAARFTADDRTLGLYHCDEGQGTVLVDSSGHRRHGKLVGAKWVRVDPEPASPITLLHRVAWPGTIGLNIVSVDISPDASFFLATRFDPTLKTRLWDSKSGTPRGNVPLGPGRFVHGNLLAAIGPNGNDIHYFNFLDLGAKEFQSFDLKGGKHGAVQFTPSAGHLWFATPTEVHVWNSWTAPKKLGSFPFTLADRVILMPDGKHLLHRPAGKPLVVRDTSTGQPVDGPYAELRDLPLLVAVSDDGRRLISGGVTDPIRVFDVATGKEVAPLEGGPRRHAVISGDGSRLLAPGSEPDTLGLWEVATGKRLGTLPLPVNAACPYKLSHDGSHAIVGTADAVYLFQLLKGHSTSSVALTPYDILTSPDYEWSEPESLGPRINSERYDSGPELSADGLTLYFHSNRGADRETKIYQATRATPTAAFADPVLLPDSINSSEAYDPTLTADELVLVYSSTRKDGRGASDLWMAERPNRQSPWGPAVNLAEVNSPRDEWEPAISADGLTLLFHSIRDGGQGGTDLYLSRRTARDKPFAAPENLGANVNGPLDEGGAALSADGRVLFHAKRLNDHFSLYMSMRESTSASFGRATGPLLANAGPIFSPCLSADGRTLLFGSFREGGRGESDIWMSRRVLTPAAAAAANSLPPAITESKNTRQ